MKELYRFRQFLTEEDFKNPILDKYLELKKSIDYKTVFPTDLQSFVDSLDNTEREGLENDLAEGKLLKEAVIWNWSGDRNELEEVPSKFKAAVKSELPKLSGEKFEAFFDAVKNSFADEAGRGSMKFTSDQWADIIKDDSSKGKRSGLDPDYDKGGKYYSEEGAEAFRIQPFKVNDIEYTQDQAVRQGKYIVGLEGEELKKFLSDYMAAWKEDVGDTPEGKTFN